MVERPGRPSGGRTEVLYVRCTKDLMAQLDKEVEVQQAENPGHTITRAGVVRTMLYDVLKEEET